MYKYVTACFKAHLPIITSHNFNSLNFLFIAVPKKLYLFAKPLVNNFDIILLIVSYGLVPPTCLIS